MPARTSPTLLPPSPRTVLSLSCFKVSQCINCRDWHCKSYENSMNPIIISVHVVLFAGTLQKHKYENCMTIDKVSWGYRRNAPLADYLTTDQIILTLSQTVR